MNERLLTEMKRRKRKKTDQANAQRGFLLIKELILSHEEIDMSQWAAALVSILVDRFVASGVPYEFFCQELETIKSHYKSRWQKDEQVD